MLFSIRNLAGKVIHQVDVGDRRVEMHAPDLRGCDFTNVNLQGAQLSFAKVDRLLGAKLKDADLRGAVVAGSLSYTDIAGCDLSEADLSGITDAYPVNVDKHTRLCGATFAHEELREMANEIVWARRRHFR